MHNKLTRLSKAALVLATACTLTFSAACQKSEDTTFTEETNTQIENTDTNEQSSNSGEVPAMDELVSSTVDGADADYQVAPPKAGDTIVTISFKDYGDVKIKMFEKEAPLAVTNFITHAKNGYFNNLTMHRIIPNFMIQGGDPNSDGTGGESIWGTEFKNETVEYLNVIRGSLCMANAGPDTNGSQFFITQAQNADLSTAGGLTELQTKMYENYGGCPWLTGGYTVFGQVYEGMDIIDIISAVETDGYDAPTTPIVISNVTVSSFES